MEEAKKYAKALRQGDPDAGAMIRQSFKQKLAEFLPGR
jgi:hypothetical protein